MDVACSNLCFSRLTISDALRTIRELRFSKVDLAIHEAGPHDRPSVLAQDVGRAAQRYKAANLGYAAFHLKFAEPDTDTIREQFKAMCRLARLLSVPVVTISALSKETPLAEEISRLREWHRIAESDGLILTVETHKDTVTHDSSSSIQLCQKIPGLGITLDPSQNLKLSDSEAESLYPFVKHVRFRDSGKEPDEFQVRIGQGLIEYGKIINAMERNGFDRTMTVDIQDIADSPFPIEPEVRKLKYLLESFL